MLVYARICSTAERTVMIWSKSLIKDLRAIVADVVESYKAEGKPLPEPRSHHRFTYTRERPTTRKCRLSNRA
jgi:hypothetical protein